MSPRFRQQRLIIEKSDIFSLRPLAFPRDRGEIPPTLVRVPRGRFSCSDGEERERHSRNIRNGSGVHVCDRPFEDVAGQSTTVPAPGALALVGAAGAIAGRRRRR